MHLTTHEYGTQVDTDMSSNEMVQNVSETEAVENRLDRNYWGQINQELFKIC